MTSDDRKVTARKPSRRHRSVSGFESRAPESASQVASTGDSARETDTPVHGSPLVVELIPAEEPNIPHAHVVDVRLILPSQLPAE